MTQAKKKKKGRIIILIVIVILVLAVIGIFSFFKSVSQSLEEMVSGTIETVAAEKRDISNYISVSGNVESESLVKVTSSLTAKCSQLNVELGSYVQEGDVLCILDSSSFQEQYDSLLKTQQNTQGQSDNSHKINERNLQNAKEEKEIAVTQAQRSLDQAVKARDDAYQKQDTLIDEINAEIANRDNALTAMNSAETPEDYEAAAETYQKAAATVETKQASLEALWEQLSTYDDAVQSAQDAYDATVRSYDQTIQSYQDVLDNEQYQQDDSIQSQLDDLAESIADCTITAPKSGMITSLNIAEGSYPSGDSLMTIEDADALKITVQINEADILNIHEGQKAIVKTSATGETEFDATVSRVVNIYSSADALTGSSGGYSAEITIDDNASALLIGMNAKVKIILEEKKDVLTVPYESVVTDEDGNCYVLLAVAGRDGLVYAKQASVETGMEGSYYVEITSSEVKDQLRKVNRQSVKFTKSS